MESFGAVSWAKFQRFVSGYSPVSSGSGIEGTGTWKEWKVMVMTVNSKASPGVVH